MVTVGRERFPVSIVSLTNTTDPSTFSAFTPVGCAIGWHDRVLAVPVRIRPVNTGWCIGGQDRGKPNLLDLAVSPTPADFSLHNRRVDVEAAAGRAETLLGI